MKTGTALIDRVSASANRSGPDFDPVSVRELSEPVRRYLLHSIEPGTPLAGRGELSMKGEIRLKGWNRFQARQVITGNMEMVWSARVRMMGMPVRGYDCLIEGGGEMSWKMLGLFPVMQASGRNVTRSAAGRVAAELVWLPSAFLLPSVELTAVDDATLSCSVEIAKEKVTTVMKIGGDGRLLSTRLKRWGNPEGDWGYHDFGALMIKESSFGGFTIPSQLRAGWHFHGRGFQNEGEFFRSDLTNSDYF